MIAADILVKTLIDHNIHHIFGLPGGAVLDFLYALERQKKRVTAHLSPHEYSAVCSAYGYARGNRSLGVAYATRGPGITNMVTGIADAYYDSVPLLIITGHSEALAENNMRVLSDQEIDVVSIFSEITKYATRIDDQVEFLPKLMKAINLALSGRPGPVLIDINRKVFNVDIDAVQMELPKDFSAIDNKITDIKQTLLTDIGNAKRPVFLLGDGLRGLNNFQELIVFAESNGIPMISSRFSQDLANASDNFFGYFGSHGLRYANFILSKADLIVSFGNRVLFQNNQSETFLKIFNQAKIIRFDIDDAELTRKLPNSIDFNIDLKDLLPEFKSITLGSKVPMEWMDVCSKIKKELDNEDTDYPVSAIAKILSKADKNDVIVSDVGNNEYWLSRAAAMVGASHYTIYSKSFGAMGSSIGKAIGIHYATQRPVKCFIGDQSLQMAIYDLHTVSQNKLPITIILINNQSSGMIRSRQKLRYNNQFLQTTQNTGYTIPDLRKVAEAYNFKTVQLTKHDLTDLNDVLNKRDESILLEIIVDDEIEMIPNVAIGDPIQKMAPLLEENLFQELDHL